MFVPDNNEGMRAVVRHLIEEHGYKRIAFICGIHGQVDAEQRFQAYKDELAAHDLRYDEDLVVDGDYTAESGREAIQTLLDERKLRVQAIVAANDRMAFGALEAGAHEDLGGGDGAINWGAVGAVEIAGGLVVGAAAGGDDVPGKGVHRLVAGDGVADPFVEEAHALLI